MIPEKTYAEPIELLRDYEEIIPHRNGYPNKENTESINKYNEKIKALKFSPDHKPSKTASFQCLQKWEGTIIEINEETFTAKLNDLTKKNPTEIAEFFIKDISEDDKLLLQTGAIFYWYVGYTKSIQGQLTRGYSIRFRRIPVWTEKEITQAKLESKNLGNEIGWK